MNHLLFWILGFVFSVMMVKEIPDAEEGHIEQGQPQDIHGMVLNIEDTAKEYQENDDDQP